jgi:hypothetical protein
MIVIMIIPMLVVKPKLHENVLALRCFISDLHHVVLCLVSYFSLFAITQALVLVLLEIIGIFLHSFVILAKGIFDRLSVGSISLFRN